MAATKENKTPVKAQAKTQQGKDDKKAPLQDFAFFMNLINKAGK